MTELLDNPAVTTTGDGGREVELCPECRRGTVVERTGRYGPFLGGSAFPSCAYTRNLSKAQAHQRWSGE